MPEEVSPNISQAFTDVIPFAIAVIIAYGIDVAIRAFTGVSFAQAVIEMFQPLFTAADVMLGLPLSMVLWPSSGLLGFMDHQLLNQLLQP